MAVFVVGLLVLLGLAMAAHSDATYCACKTGLNDTALQRSINYACGAGADCSAILQNGACFNPNTVRDHCNYAVNSYYQRKGQFVGSCDFSGTAAVTKTAPSNAASGCVYQSTPRTGSPNTGGTLNTGNGAGGTGNFPGSAVPPGGGGGIGLAPTGSGFGNFPGSTVPPGGGGIGLAPTGSGTGNFPGSTVPPGGGGIDLAPTGSGFDNSAGLRLLSLSSITTTIMLMFFSLTLLLSGFK